MLHFFPECGLSAPTLVSVLPISAGGLSAPAHLKPVLIPECYIHARVCFRLPESISACHQSPGYFEDHYRPCSSHPSSIQGLVTFVFRKPPFHVDYGGQFLYRVLMLAPLIQARYRLQELLHSDQVVLSSKKPRLHSRHPKEASRRTKQCKRPKR